VRRADGAPAAKLIDRPLQVRGRDRHVGLADVAPEVHFADRVLRGLEGELEQSEDRGRVLARDVGLRGAPEDAQQLLAVAEDPPRPSLLLDRRQERLVARRAHEVVVEVAVAHVVGRVAAARLLVALVDVDRRVVERAPLGGLLSLK